MIVEEDKYTTMSMKEAMPHMIAAPSGYDQNIMRLLAEKYPSKEAVYEKLIYLMARLSLPKEVEHFMSDLHGEYDLFYHIINNCSGVIREKVDYVFGVRMTQEEKAEFCTLIYYPREKLRNLHEEGRITPDWYRKTLYNLLELAKVMSYKFPSFKIRGFIPEKYASIILELINTRPEGNEAQMVYHQKLFSAIVAVNAAEDCIFAFTVFIKRMAVNRLHIIGDFFDRGSRPDVILDNLIEHKNVDIQWGNHDALWMGASMGNKACIAAVVRNSLHYGNTDVLERGYGINLRTLTTFAARRTVSDTLHEAERIITLMMFKLEGALIKRNPDFRMNERLLLDKIDRDKLTVTLADGKAYPLKDFPTDMLLDNPYALTAEEESIIDDLVSYFVESTVLARHVDYLYRVGGIYTRYNGNLLFHSSLPLKEDGTFRPVVFGGEAYTGRNYFDYADSRARQAYLNRNADDTDFMYFLWCGYHAPTAGREFHTFERAYIVDETTWQEPADPYFTLIDNEDICRQILTEFDLNPDSGHIVNGHVPVRVRQGESPLKAHGKAIVIDGGFAAPYHKKTGISGYTLIANSRGLRLLEHQKIANVRTALKENHDIESVSDTVELVHHRMTVGDTDHGQGIKDEIDNLQKLLAVYTGELPDTLALQSKFAQFR